MSCRVFGRNVEDAFLETLVKKAIKDGVEEITIDIEETEKNLPAREFVQKYFTHNTLSTKSHITNPFWITVHHENI